MKTIENKWIRLLIAFLITTVFILLSYVINIYFWIFQLILTASLLILFIYLVFKLLTP